MSEDHEAKRACRAETHQHSERQRAEARSDHDRHGEPREARGEAMNRKAKP
jgi:hypothetical protein